MACAMAEAESTPEGIAPFGAGIGRRDRPGAQAQETVSCRALPPGFFGRVSSSTPSLYFASAAA